MSISTDKQNALRRECTFKIEIVLEIGVAGINYLLKDTSFDTFGCSSSTSSVGWTVANGHRFLPMSRRVTRSNPINYIFFSFWSFNLHAIIVI